MERKFKVESRFVTLGKDKKLRVYLFLYNFFDESAFQINYCGNFKLKDLVVCDLRITVKCDRTELITFMKQSEYCRIKGNTLKLIFDAPFQQDSIIIDVNTEKYSIKMSYTATHKYLNELYGQQCMEKYNQKRKRAYKSLKEVTILRGRPMSGGGCTPR